MNETFTTEVKIEISEVIAKKIMTKAQYLEYEERCPQLTAKIQWRCQLELREWGIKDVYITVPDQTIVISSLYFGEYFAFELVDTRVYHLPSLELPALPASLCLSTVENFIEMA